MISAAFTLAWRYVARHRGQTLLLAAALGVVLALPISLRVLVRTAESALRARSTSTPLVMGARGSSLDLLLTALYFKRQPLPPVEMRHVQEVRTTKLAKAIPLDARFHAQEAPIVGTTLDYFDFRKLRLAQGRMLTRLGDCVLGANVAARRQLKAGDAIFSSQEQVFDMAGVYPLKMRITGVLAPAGTPDDDAVFVDLKTCWLIQGLAHGHDDVAAQTDTVLEAKDGNVVANASVRMFNEVTDKNIGTFHFHGDTSSHALSAILVLPVDAKSEAILSGRYLKTGLPVQLIRPAAEFDSLMTTLFQVEGLAIAVLAATLGAALAVSALVFALSFRLRARQFATLADLGLPPSALWWTRCFEVSIVGAAGVVAAGLITLVVQWNAPHWVHLLLA